MSFPRTFTVLAAGLTVTAMAIVGFALRADDASSELKSKYRRPEALRHEGRPPSSDPVWQLGQTLFFDPALSASRQLSCASCHKPGGSWTDHLAKAQGEGAQPLRFRAPTLLNAGYQERYGWEGSFPDIATVAFVAMSSSLNMNMSADQLIKRLGDRPDYVTSFKDTFPDGAVSKRHIGEALTRYVSSITAGEAPFDRWIDGDERAIDASAKRGFALFNGKAECAACHSGWSLSDGSFHDIGIGRGGDIGRGAKFKTSVKLLYAFKTPTLRDVAQRAPYMHDGSLKSLAEVVDHYDKGGIDRPSRDGAIHPLHLSAGEKADLVAFLETLDGSTRFALQDDAGANN